MLAVLDTGPLVAVVDSNDPDHDRAVDILQRSDLQFVVPALVIGEIIYFINKRLGPDVEARFLARLVNFDIQNPHPDDWPRIAELVSIYRDFPLGGVHASVIALAERLNTDLIVTLDQRHFRAVRPRHVEAFRRLPD